MSLNRTTQGFLGRDNFDRANGAPGADWNQVVGSKISIFGNQLLSDPDGADRQVIEYVPTADLTEAFIQVVSFSAGSGHDPVILLAYDDAGDNGYIAGVAAAHPDVRIWRVDAGVETLIAESTDDFDVVVVDGDELRQQFYFSPSVQQVWCRHVRAIAGQVQHLQATGSDPNYTSGAAGLAARVSSGSPADAEWDDFIICRNKNIVCTNLPTDHQLRILEAPGDGPNDAVLAAREVNGTATIDASWWGEGAMDVPFDGWPVAIVVGPGLTELARYDAAGVYPGDEFTFDGAQGHDDPRVTDFTEYGRDLEQADPWNPDDWTRRHQTVGNFFYIREGDDNEVFGTIPGRQGLRYMRHEWDNSSGDAFRTLTWDKVGSPPGDIEIEVDVYKDFGTSLGADTIGAGIMAMATGGVSAEDGYILAFYEKPFGVEAMILAKYEGGAQTWSVVQDFAWTSENRFRLKLGIFRSENEVRAKFWDKGTGEPTEWDITQGDNAILAANPVGVFARKRFNWRFDDFQVFEFTTPCIPPAAKLTSEPAINILEGLFLGEAGGNGVYELGVGHDDAASAFNFVIQPNEIAPEGQGGEALFRNLYLTVSRDNPSSFVLKVTPIVDGVNLPEIDVTLPGVTDPKNTEQHEISLRQELNGYHYHPRGTWFAYRIHGDCLALDGDLIFEGVELEYETLQESEEPV